MTPRRRARLTEAAARLLKLQRKIHRSLRDEADWLLGETPDAIKRYARGYARDFPAHGPLRPASKLEILRAVRAADITLVADFHAFDQAPRTALRILRDARRAGEPWVLGLELASSEHQGAIDAYLRGEISLEDFHCRIAYADSWGFPWRNYAPLFQWARENKVPICALNRPVLPGEAGAFDRGEGSDLLRRDLWAAGLLTDLFADAPAQGPRRLRAVVLYGELHVASAHLPRKIREISRPYLGRALKCVTLHQNHEDTYWRLAARGLTHSTHAVHLPRGNFCLLSSPPWTRLQSLVSWAEGEEPTAETDYLSLLKSCGEVLTEYLRMKAPSYEALSVASVRDADAVLRLPKAHLLPIERSLVRFHVERNIRVYIPRAHVAYLGTPSQNSAAELAGIHVFRAASRSETLFERTAEDLARQVLEAAFGFLCSLLVNPRRKCDLPEDHRARLTALARGQKPRFPGERDARRLALALVEGLGQERPAAFNRALAGGAPAPALMMAARFAGQILGRAIHEAMLAGTVNADWVASLARPRMAGAASNFLGRTQGMGRVLQRARRTQSKHAVL